MARLIGRFRVTGLATGARLGAVVGLVLLYQELWPADTRPADEELVTAFLPMFAPDRVGVTAVATASSSDNESREAQA